MRVLLRPRGRANRQRSLNVFFRQETRESFRVSPSFAQDIEHQASGYHTYWGPVRSASLVDWGWAGGKSHVVHTPSGPGRQLGIRTAAQRSGRCRCPFPFSPPAQSTIWGEGRGPWIAALSPSVPKLLRLWLPTPDRRPCEVGDSLGSGTSWGTVLLLDQWTPSRLSRAQGGFICQKTSRLRRGRHASTGPGHHCESGSQCGEEVRVTSSSPGRSADLAR